MTINLKHESCGGYYHSFSTRGKEAGFRCEKCKEILYVTAEDEESEHRRHQELEEFRKRLETIPNPPPLIPIRKLTVIEALKLQAYRGWSEDTYAATFITNGSKEFIKSMENQEIFEDFEEKLLNELEGWP